MCERFVKRWSKVTRFTGRRAVFAKKGWKYTAKPCIIFPAEKNQTARRAGNKEGIERTVKQFCKKFAAAAVAVLLTALLPCSAFAATSMARNITLRDDYFDDAVFVGDSISLKLKNYVNKQRKREPGFFGNAEFLTVGGLGSGNVQLPITPDSLHPRYNGEKMYLEDSVAATGAKKMYIMFGMNDIVPYGVEGAIENLETLIDKILAKSPDLTVAVESVTPILTEKQQRNLNNDSIAAYNEALQELCGRRGFEYLDIGSQLAGGDGGLVYEYCGDAPGLGMHLSDAGCVPWVEYLRTHPITEVAPPEEEASGEAEEDGLSFGQEEAEDDTYDSQEDKPVFADYDPQAEEEAEAPKDSTDIYKEFALDVTNARPSKPWRPKLKGRLLN